MDSKGQNKDSAIARNDNRAHTENFVLEKGIFTNIFEKDIKRVYIYKKAERLAKAIHLVSPAFRNSLALRDRMDKVAIGLVDSAILPPLAARDGMSRELLALSSVLSIARIGGLLSPMNADLIAREAQQLLQEIATYEEPRLFLDESPSLAALAREAGMDGSNSYEFSSDPAKKASSSPVTRMPKNTQPSDRGQFKGQIKDKPNDRKEAIHSILLSKGPSYIKDISTVIRDVSEKTIQRELQAMIEGGQVAKTGERRWTVYSLV